MLTDWSVNTPPSSPPQEGFSGLIERVTFHSEETGFAVKSGAYMTKRFPYLIFFSLKGDAVLVHAVLHGHRDDRHWKDRL